MVVETFQLVRDLSGSALDFFKRVDVTFHVYIPDWWWWCAFRPKTFHSARKSRNGYLAWSPGKLNLQAFFYFTPAPLKNLLCLLSSSLLSGSWEILTSVRFLHLCRRRIMWPALYYSTRPHLALFTALRWDFVPAIGYCFLQDLYLSTTHTPCVWLDDTEKLCKLHR